MSLPTASEWIESVCRFFIVRVSGTSGGPIAVIREVGLRYGPSGGLRGGADRGGDGVSASRREARLLLAAAKPGEPVHAHGQRAATAGVRQAGAHPSASEHLRSRHRPVHEKKRIWSARSATVEPATRSVPSFSRQSNVAAVTTRIGLRLFGIDLQNERTRSSWREAITTASPVGCSRTETVGPASDANCMERAGVLCTMPGHCGLCERRHQ